MINNAAHRIAFVDMSVPQRDATVLLTEHLGYPPLCVVDDVINAVNDLMYQCTKATEEFLKQHTAAPPVEEDGVVVSAPPAVLAHDLDAGTAQLESLLELVVDRNFDKFELYTIRNVLAIPNDLASGGWVRLPHHRGVDYSVRHPAQTAAQRLEGVRRRVLERDRLRAQLKQARTELARLEDTKRQVELVAHPQDPAAAAAAKHLMPLDETVRFAVAQAQRLVAQTQATERRVRRLERVRRATGGTSREAYIEARLARILAALGIAVESPRQDRTEEEVLEAEGVARAVSRGNDIH